MRQASQAAHVATCQQLANHEPNLPMPSYINPNSSHLIPAEFESKSIEAKKKSIKKKPSKAVRSRAEPEIDQEYLKFYQEGLKYREEYGKISKFFISPTLLSIFLL